MYNKFRLEIITPEREFFNGEVEELIIDSVDGKMGFLKGHHPMIVALSIGSMRILVDNEWKEAANSEGFVEVLPEKITVMAQTVEWPEEIEVNREEAKILKARERMRQKKSMLEYKMGKASLARALSRLKVKSRHRSD